MNGLRSVAALLLCLPAVAGQGHPASDERPGAKVWVGRYAEIEEYLRTAECIRVESFGPGRAVRCTLRPGGPVARMAWRSLPPGVYRGFRESYKAEIAAYEIDKLLKLDMVPPSIERRLDGVIGAAQLWVENVAPLTGNASPGPSTRAQFDQQLVRMTMFDNLIGYRDRNAANTLRDGGGNLILIDHSRAFSPSPDLPTRLTGIDLVLWQKIGTLTRPQLSAALGRWISQEEIAAILDRRQRMKAEIASLSR